jgi:ankyrin repeat protein
MTPLTYATSLKGQQKIIDYLLNQKLNSVANGAMLAWLAGSGEIDLIKKALSKGINIDSPSYNRKDTPLMWAIASGRIRTTRFLIEKGANLHLKNSANENILEIAQNYRKKEIVNYLQQVYHPKVRTKQEKEKKSLNAIVTEFQYNDQVQHIKHDYHQIHTVKFLQNHKVIFKKFLENKTKVLIVTRDKVKIWDIKSKKLLKLLTETSLESNHIIAASLNSDNSKISLRKFNGTTNIWDIEREKIIKVIDLERKTLLNAEKPISRQ